MKRDEVTNRIWRTVVFSGAMLAAPMASADKAEPPKADLNAKPDTHESVTKLLDANMASLLAAIDALVAAPKDGSLYAKVAELRKARTALEARLAKLPPPPPPAASVAKLQKQLADHDAKLVTAIDRIGEAKDPMGAVKALGDVRKERTGIERQLKAEIEKQRRPRTPDQDRPTGRGFVLG
jgi:hypothetical protein